MEKEKENARGPLKLVFIYGPPAVGKLTVAEELAKITGYEIFHNHLTVDIGYAVFKHGTENFFRYLETLRFEVLEKSAKEGDHHLIATFCYVHNVDDLFIKKLTKKIEKYGGEICFVHLCTPMSVLKKRVQEDSRKKFKKIKTAKKLHMVLGGNDFGTPIPFVKTLSIDNTNISPKKTAQLIKKHYNL